jgi:hypothetical protein
LAPGWFDEKPVHAKRNSARALMPMCPIAHAPQLLGKMGSVRAFGRITLTEGDEGGLRAPMPSPARSLLLRLDGGTGVGELDIGVQITTPDGAPLKPGTSELAVELVFWSDLADLHIAPRCEFELRYPIRVVGRGVIDQVDPSPTS